MERGTDPWRPCYSSTLLNPLHWGGAQPDPSPAALAGAGEDGAGPAAALPVSRQQIARPSPAGTPTPGAICCLSHLRLLLSLLSVCQRAERITSSPPPPHLFFSNPHMTWVFLSFSWLNVGKTGFSLFS